MKYLGKGNTVSGFTLIEIVITLSIVGVITLITVGALSKTNRLKSLEKESSVVISLLEQARGKTLSAKDAVSYGVHFDSGKAVLFKGSVYSSGASTNVVETMDPIVSISAINLSGGGNDVIFNRLTGETAQSGTVTLSLVASSTISKTVTIFSTGVVESN